MSAKGGKKGKKGKKDKKADDPNKLTQVDRQFYELTITDLNQKLSRLRSHLLNLDDTNMNLTEKLRELEEDRVDVAAHLDRELAESNDVVEELEERLLEITKVRDAENAEAQAAIKELEAKFKAMHDQLTSEIKLLNGKLNSLDEFRVQRDILLAKFDDQDADLKEKDRSHAEALYNMEQKAVVEKDALKKEVEAKLLQVSEDFTRSSEIRNAGYTRRLIRENIALQKEIDTLVLSQLKMQQQFNMQEEHNKEMKDRFAATDRVKKDLILSCQHKIRIIEKLTSSYENLKVELIAVAKYKSLYENLAKRDVCSNFKFQEMSKKMRVLGQRVDALKLEKTQLETMHEHHEAEITRLRSVILQIKSTVQMAIQAIEVPHDQIVTTESDDSIAFRNVKRQDLLAGLLEIVSSHSDKLPQTPSVASYAESGSSLYRPGKMGFLPRSSESLLEIFKRDVKKVASAEMVPFEFSIKQVASKYIPKARSVDGESLIDVELGSTLYVSSSQDDLGQAESEQLEGEDASSSEYQSSFSGMQETKPAAAVVDEPPPKLSPKESRISKKLTDDTNVEVSRTTPIEGEDDDDDDENSINLFY